MLTRTLALLFLLSICTCGLAQDIILTGSVVDDKTNDPLPFVYLKLDDAALGTVTEADGRYRLTVPERYAAYTIIVSYLGYESQEVGVAELKKRSEPLRLRQAATELTEITVTPEKLPSARAILKRVFRNLDKNYPQEFSHHDGYYRETLQENGAYIKLADAVVTYRSAPYLDKKYKWKHYVNTMEWGTTMVSFFGFDPREHLHRSHFHHRTLKEEQVHVHDARGSENATTRHMNGNIIGGPLGLFGRDRMKYQEAFLGPKRNRGFNFLVDEVNYGDRGYVYALRFRTTTTKADLEALPDTHKKVWRQSKRWVHANKHKMLEGTIYVDKDSYAVLGYDCHIPNELKPYFCGYKEMRIKHFDYQLEARYAEVDGKFVLDYLRHSDEFIFKDTTDQVITPYVATSEFSRTGTDFAPTKAIPEDDHFANVDRNELYNFPLEYDSLYWAAYLAEHPGFAIPDNIRDDLSREKPLERQFGDRLRRDPDLPPPVAPIDPSSYTLHGQRITDDYAWLKDRKDPRANPRVMDYLRAENAYAENYFRPLRKTQRNVFRELKMSVEKEYKSLPTVENGFVYTYSYGEDDEYPVFLRAPVSDTAAVDTLMNVNKEAAKHDYFNAGGIQFSPNNELMSWYENTTGSDNYVIRFRNHATQTALADSLLHAGQLVWLDDATLLYSRQEPNTLRTSRVYRHRLGTPQATDELVYEETDPLYNVGIGRSRSRDFIWLTCSSTETTETRYLRTDQPTAAFRVFLPREEKHRYSVNHHGDNFYVVSNDKGAVNGAVYTVDTSNIERKHWQLFIPHRPEVQVSNVLAFDKYLVLTEWEAIQPRIRVIERATMESRYLPFKGNKIYDVGLGYNPDPATDTLQVVYTSYDTPTKTMNFHLGTFDSRLVRQRKSGIRVGKLIVKREYATAPDGTLVPLTLVYNKWQGGAKEDHKRVYLTSYGAYGSGQQVGYSPFVYTLLNRGFTYVIAHVRGGGDLGPAWHDGGRLLNKQNTFDDFIAVGDWLVENDYAGPGSITAQGGSAGGLLMGAVVNKRPDLFKAVILDVPFVDVINTMLDETLPLTTGEYLEWGNPNDKKYYKYIREYSPYENVKEQAYPNLFFFTGLNDTRVGYWEPAKMAAKLRALKTDGNVLLLKTDFTAGHGGGSGRYAGLQEAAYKLALIFDLYATESAR